MTVDEGVDITKIGDRGVLKRIIKEGEGTDTPSGGCKVKVHYTGTLLDGTKFDSSKDRNEPFTFDLGQGSVIKAWEIGIATMKKGEVCVLTCAPEYAYGKAGSSPKIPPDSTLQFEVEMIDWEMEDLSPAKNKGILRQIIEPGVSGGAKPTDRSLVTIEIEGKLASDGKVFDNRTVSFELGEGIEYDLCVGLEKALEKMKKGEKSKFIIQPQYAFKSEGNAKLGVPPNAVVEYTVNLVKVEKSTDIWCMQPGELLEQGKIAKEKGTKYFKENKLHMAVKMYKRAVEFLKKDTSDEEAIRKEFKEVILSVHLNLALVYLKMSPPCYFEAKGEANEALEIDEKNIKGLFRRGSALLGLKEAELALKDFQKVLEAEPQNKAAANQAILCRNTILKQKQREKQMYANMFDKFAKHDAEVEKLRAENEVDVIGEKVGEWGAGEGEWTDEQRDRKPTEFEKENPNILLLDNDGQFKNM